MGARATGRAVVVTNKSCAESLGDVRTSAMPEPAFCFTLPAMLSSGQLGFAPISLDVGAHEPIINTPMCAQILESHSVTGVEQISGVGCCFLGISSCSLSS